MFGQRYNIKTGQIHQPPLPDQQANTMALKPEHEQWSKAKGMGLKMKIYNFKFMGYSLYATLI